MQIDFLKGLYEYNYWANNRLLHAVEGISDAQLNAEMSNGVGTMRTTLVHILPAAAWAAPAQAAARSPRSQPLSALCNTLPWALFTNLLLPAVVQVVLPVCWFL